MDHAIIFLSLTYNNDGSCIASGSDDNTIKIWDMSNGGALLQTLRGHADWVRSVAYNNDGSYLASGSVDGTIKIWDMGNGGVL